MKPRPVCQLCETTTGVIRSSLVRWREPWSVPYSHVDRCVDVAACRARLEERGETWPIVEPEGTP